MTAFVTWLALETLVKASMGLLMAGTLLMIETFRLLIAAGILEIYVNYLIFDRFS
jgi:hypothetical protein